MWGVQSFVSLYRESNLLYKLCQVERALYLVSWYLVLSIIHLLYMVIGREVADSTIIKLNTRGAGDVNRNEFNALQATSD